MKLGIVLYSNDPETVWNAFRLGTFSLRQGDTVSAFLLGKGVEAASLAHPDFDTTAQIEAFTAAGGTIQACGTCLKLRHSEHPEHCALSTMQDLYAILRDADRVVTF